MRLIINTEPVVNAWMASGGNICLKYRYQDGATYVRRHRYWYTSYHQTNLLTDDTKKYLRDTKHVASVEVEGDWTRVEWASYQARKIHNDEELPDGTPNPRFSGNSFEADVQPIRRFMVDHDMPIGEPKRVFLDIETDSRKSFVDACSGLARVLCWTLVDEASNVVTGLLEHDTDADEQRVLNELWEQITKYDQVIAWNGDGFDFPVIIERSKVIRAKQPNSETILWLDQLLLFKRMNNAESAEEKVSFKLQDIAMAMLGEGKDDLDGSKTWQYWVEGGESRQRLLKYNIKDTQLLLKLEEKTGFIKLLQALAVATGIFPDSKGLQPLSQVDSFMLRLGKKRGVHFRTNHGNASAVVRGAYVMQPETEGVERCIHVADFRRLYPSIILSWNMSPETLKQDGGDGCKCPTIESTFDNTKGGILPVALKELIRLRAEWTDKKASLSPGTSEWFDADRLSTAYKVAANSFYGVMASPFSRFFHPLIAESVTQTGVYLIQETKKRAEEHGMKVVYADTDSIFVRGVSVEQFKKFVEQCNKEFYPQIAKQFGCIENDIHLAYEKAFDRIVFVSAKKYAGSYLHYKGKSAVEGSKPEVKGLEYKRGDSTRFARQLQEQVINLLLGGLDNVKAFEDVVQLWQNRILRQPLELADVVMVKSISRKLDQYSTRRKKDGSMSLPPRHVQVAEEMKLRGEEVREGTKINMVVMDATTKPPTVIPASDYKGECDRHYLWDSLVYPPTERLLQSAFPQHVWSMFGKTRPAQSKKTSRGAKVAIVASENAPVAVVAKGRRKTRQSEAQSGLFGGDSPIRIVTPDLIATETPGLDDMVRVATDTWKEFVDQVGKEPEGMLAVPLQPIEELALTRLMDKIDIPRRAVGIPVQSVNDDNSTDSIDDPIAKQLFDNNEVVKSLRSASEWSRKLTEQSTMKAQIAPCAIQQLGEQLRLCSGHIPFVVDLGFMAKTYRVNDLEGAKRIVESWRHNYESEAK